jgi:hypothetical protein
MYKHATVKDLCQHADCYFCSPHVLCKLISYIECLICNLIKDVYSVNCFFFVFFKVFF